MSTEGPERVQRHPQAIQRCPQMSTEGPKRSTEGPQRAQRCPQGMQGGPQRFTEDPKTSTEGPERVQRDPQENPKRSTEDPQCQSFRSASQPAIPSKHPLLGQKSSSRDRLLTLTVALPRTLAHRFTPVPLASGVEWRSAGGGRQPKLKSLKSLESL